MKDRLFFIEWFGGCLFSVFDSWAFELSNCLHVERVGYSLSFAFA